MPPRKPEQPHSRREVREYQRLYKQKERARWTEEKKKRAREATKKHWTTKGYYARMGLTKEEYDVIFERQEGKCAGCLKIPKDRLCIDHDHKTGRVRALLCRSCNMALGLLKDNVETMERLIALILYREATHERDEVGSHGNEV